MWTVKTKKSLMTKLTTLKLVENRWTHLQIWASSVLIPSLKNLIFTGDFGSKRVSNNMETRYFKAIPWLICQVFIKYISQSFITSINNRRSSLLKSKISEPHLISTLKNSNLTTKPLKYPEKSWAFGTFSGIWVGSCKPFWSFLVLSYSNTRR